ncbi:MAG: non-canonical purine NTP pyrophosphatase, partial [Phycisphaerae bacterium]|nr:non-canonical purine NTP pyrophosphatase [Phycisphaerae bacterium]
FFVPSFGKTMAEIPPAVKNRISHRACALRAFKEKLKDLI